MLPSSIVNKKAILNPLNNGQLSFKWSILAKHVTGINKHHIGDNYFRHEGNYELAGLFPYNTYGS